MLDISIADIRRRLTLDNPWWQSGRVARRFVDMPRRDYFEPFMALVEGAVRRSVVLMGPRRIGKTVMLHQAMHRLIEAGVDPRHILHVPLDAPIYDGMGLERFVLELVDRAGLTPEDRFYALFDEVQYLKDWEVHLKSLHDTWPEARFVVSGSAAAALRRQSQESGAGRFTDFVLPPLTFREFLRLAEREAECGVTGEISPETVDIHRLNEALVDYLNYGGFPEAVVDPAIRGDSARYIRHDIIDKVLLRDLPSLYGIQDVQELNRFFAHLAYNTGQEVSLDGLAKKSQVTKNTLRRYLEYLEAAFLIVTLDRVDRDAKRFKRRTHFKVYLTNPAIRAALFGAIDPEHEQMGAMVETALLAQWAHWPAMRAHLAYARWRGGHEVDLVYMRGERPLRCLEIKWSDRFVDRPRQLTGLVHLGDHAARPRLLATTRTRWASTEAPRIRHMPAAVEILEVGGAVVDVGRESWLKQAE